jgi:prepilin-type N-terminal cleavage/methylation domain-containing protein/prepilin-type processing-associated H-X9-DG protein
MPLLARRSLDRPARLSSGGFTLVELLVVIAIIAVLISLLMPSLARVRQSASAAQCMSNLRQIGTAMVMYSQANRDRLPLAYWSGDGDVHPPTSGSYGATDWAYLILPYLGRAGGSTYNFNNPAAIWRIFRDADTISGSANVGNAQWYDPEKTQTYGVHPVLFRFAPGPINANNSYTTGSANPARGSSDDGMVPFRYSQIGRASELIMVIDNAQFGDTLDPYSRASDADCWRMQGDTTSWAHQWATIDSLAQPGFVWTKPEAGRNRDFPTHGGLSPEDITIRFRHMGNRQANALFVDGHVGAFAWQRPGLGGSDLSWRNILVDDHRNQEKLFR